MKSTTLAAMAAGAVQTLVMPGAYAAGDDTLKIGLVGCGGRGSGAASQALKTKGNVKLVAMGDAFPAAHQGGRRKIRTSRSANDKSVLPSIRITCFLVSTPTRRFSSPGSMW